MGRGSWIGARVLVLAIALALAAASLSATAFAATAPTSGYEQKPNTPTTSTPKSGTAPSKESEKPTPTTSTPATEPAPTTTSSTPTTSQKATTLPFTGFDLRWEIGLALLLIAAGVSIVVVQRRQRRAGER